MLGWAGIQARAWDWIPPRLVVYWQDQWRAASDEDLPPIEQVFVAGAQPVQVQGVDPVPPYAMELPCVDADLGALAPFAHPLTIRLVPERNCDVGAWRDLFQAAILDSSPLLANAVGEEVPLHTDQMCFYLRGGHALQLQRAQPLRPWPSPSFRLLWSQAVQGWRLLVLTDPQAWTYSRVDTAPELKALMNMGLPWI